MAEITYRTVGKQDEEAALTLWDSVFGPGRDYFQRYFNVDPWYREGDCLGAWDGDRLVSAVHLCRRPVEWGNRTLWCGAIANVATLPEFRRRGLSRDLLRGTIQRMEETGMGFSMLFTGTHGHYAALGWEQVREPRPTVTLSDGLPPSPVLWEPARENVQTYADLYGALPAPPLLLERPNAYFNGWSAWSWRAASAELLHLPERGYAAVRSGTESARVAEWRSADAEADAALLLGVAAWARARGTERVTFEAAPLHNGPAALEALGTVSHATSGGMMLRNVTLADAEYREIVRLYTTGEAVWWPADGF